MKKYSILIVGVKCFSGHLREFIDNLKKTNPLVEVTLIATFIRKEYWNDLSECVDRIIPVKKYKGRIKIPFIKNIINKIFLYRAFSKLQSQNNFDIVNIHFANEHIKNVMPLIRKMSNNIVISPWGSDVMRVEDKKSIKKMRRIYSCAKYVTISATSQIGKCVITKFKVNPEKMVKLGWGGEFFDFVQKNAQKVTTEVAKAKFGLNDRYVITCGYNTQPGQRHENIINAIYEIKEKLPNNLTLLFPFTYGRSAKNDIYTSQIVEKCKEKGFDTVVIDYHLEMIDLLKLRMATDIFVHIQETDAGSRCVMEYILCNKKVIHGSWIKYAYLEDYKPSCYFPVDKMENLSSVIMKAYNAKIEELPQLVKSIILERGWNFRMPKWNAFFESLIS